MSCLHDYKKDFPFKPVPDNLRENVGFEILEKRTINESYSGIFKNIFIDKCDFKSSGLFTFTDFELKNSSFPFKFSVHLNMNNGLVYNVSIRNKNWLDSQCCNVNFVESDLSYSKFGTGFGKTILKDVKFINCDLSYANFENMDLTTCVFRGCNLQGANFNGAKLSPSLKMALRETHKSERLESESFPFDGILSKENSAEKMALDKSPKRNDRQESFNHILSRENSAKKTVNQILENPQNSGAW